MIRYPVTEKQIREQISTMDEEWLGEAKIATRQLKEDQAYSKIGPNWSDIKPVYMEIQHNKCGFCERLLPAAQFGRTEHDVEHFRPKSRALKWPGARSELDYEYETGQALDDGYYWLAYEPLNYLTACKTCNSNRKRDYFPIMKERGPRHKTVRQLLKQEKPFLIYPLAGIDVDPEKVLGFHGVVPVCPSTNQQRRRRAEIIIGFFALDIRDELVIERFAVIDRLLNHLENLHSNAPRKRQRAQARIDEMIADSAPHANCARSFLRLFDQDPRLAYDHYVAGEQLVAEIRRLAGGT